MSALELTVVQCSRGTLGPSLRRRERSFFHERFPRLTTVAGDGMPLDTRTARAAPRSDHDDLWGYTNVYLASADRTTYAGARMATVWRTSGFLE
jgi:hypothetical protein